MTYDNSNCLIRISGFRKYEYNPLQAFTSKSQSRSWKAVELGIMAVSWPLSTVPTKEKVRWRMWLLSSERFFFSSIARSCETVRKMFEYITAF